MSDVTVTQADVNAAAVYWVGCKSRETGLDDIRYFEANWSSLPGMKACVQAFARHRIAAHTKALIEGAGEVEKRLLDHAHMIQRDGLGAMLDTARQAATTIAALRAELVQERAAIAAMQAERAGVVAQVRAAALSELAAADADLPDTLADSDGA